jgi:hypothetical protein
MMAYNSGMDYCGCCGMDHCYLCGDPIRPGEASGTGWRKPDWTPVRLHTACWDAALPNAAAQVRAAGYATAAEAQAVMVAALQPLVRQDATRLAQGRWRTPAEVRVWKAALRGHKAWRHARRGLGAGRA